MEYKGIEYQVVQTSNSTNWKWTVVVDGNQICSGESWSRAAAVLDAEAAIEKVIKIKVAPPAARRQPRQ